MRTAREFTGGMVQCDLWQGDSAAPTEFDAWIATDHGQAVWHWFVFFARQARAAGFKRFSARAIAERIRWQVSIETPSAGRFKLDDHHLPRLARKLMAEMPDEFAGFFETRELRK